MSDNKLNLDRVTLVCVASEKYLSNSLTAMQNCLFHAKFADVKLFNDDYNTNLHHDEILHKIGVLPYKTPYMIDSIESYCKFIVKDLVNYIDTDFALIVQHDGFILNPKAWTDDFYLYDYIGAPWWHQDYEGTRNVGNGGFSLRSKKFLQTGSEINLDNYCPEDDILCRQKWGYMIGRGIMFAPESVANKFSIEYCGKFGGVWDGQFGFHDWRTNRDNYGKKEY